MEPLVAVALASFVGAVIFFMLGYVVAAKPAAQSDASLAVAPESPASMAQSPAPTLDEVSSGTPRRGRAAAPTMRIVRSPAVAQRPLRELVKDFAHDHGTESAAIYDAQGLLVFSIGPGFDPAIGALVGLLGRCLREAGENTILAGPGAIEVNAGARGVVTCQYVEWRGTTLLLTAVGPRVDETNAHEELVRALPELLAS